MVDSNENDDFDKESNGEDIHPGLGFAINDINIKTEQQSGHFLLDMLSHGEINLNTPFQRSSDLWPAPAMSRFIESMMLRFPIPPFYFNIGFQEQNSRKPFWEVIDGLQRLSALQRFFIGDVQGVKLKLSGLDFFTELNGATVDDLPRHLKRNIESCQITLFVVYPNTPKQVKYRIFERVNTGGLKLNDQEIRHALNQGRPAVILEMATELGLTHNGFKIPPGRMKDRELALRCLAFQLFGADGFPGSMKRFLDDALEELGRISDKESNDLISSFSSSVQFIRELFGSAAFKRPDSRPFNRALFDSYTYIASKLSNPEKRLVLSKKDLINRLYIESFNDNAYVMSITAATARVENINMRFSVAHSLFKKVLI